ncbi:alpha-isopropylmalate synthase regulatory domain-containing protein [Streptomyces sp. NPDC053367]|uniref:alpha-isopropylmalate synthase regulatory domain-containing protein n=1 Tax=Streptomyces sp. NPDC053367 TaxID=3365700 RepID=UPI0037D0D64A
MADRRIRLHDTTLRDLDDAETGPLPLGQRLTVLRCLKAFGVPFVDGGSPHLPDAAEFYRVARSTLPAGPAQLVAVGRVGRPGPVNEGVRTLLEAGTGAVTLLCRTPPGGGPYHSRLALDALDERLVSLHSTVLGLAREGCRVFVDAEHYFDGYAANREFALELVRTAVSAGAERVVLCDSRGGSLPDEVGRVVADTVALTGAAVGIHCGNRSGCATAATLAAVAAGADHVHGTALREATHPEAGADLLTVAQHLVRKRGLHVVPADRLREMALAARSFEEVLRHPLPPLRPAGRPAPETPSAPVRGTARVPAARQGGMTALRTVARGRAAVTARAGGPAAGGEVGDAAHARAAARVKEREERGYRFDDAQASLELLLWSELAGQAEPHPIRVESWRVGVNRDRDGGLRTEGHVRLRVDGVPLTATATGNSPVDALHAALHSALDPFFPEFAPVRLRDYRIRMLDGPPRRGAEDSGSDPRPLVRAVACFHDGQRGWGTVGVHENTVAAVWEALLDAVAYALLSKRHPLRRRSSGYDGG